MKQHDKNQWYASNNIILIKKKEFKWILFLEAILARLYIYIRNKSNERVIESYRLNFVTSYLFLIII